jgi:hypothetical protein
MMLLCRLLFELHVVTNGLMHIELEISFWPYLHKLHMLFCCSVHRLLYELHVVPNGHYVRRYFSNNLHFR